MPLFRQIESKPERERQRRIQSSRTWTEDADGPSPLVHLCLQSVAENMKEMWVKDYAQNYMDQYFFRYVVGPFSSLPSDLLEELLRILSSRTLLTRAALHLLLLPQLRRLSLASACSLVNNNLCSLLQIRCQNLQSLDLSGAQNVSAMALCELLNHLPHLHSLSLAGTLSDPRVVSVVAQRFSKMKHLDVSRCLHLTHIDLLPLGRREPLVKEAALLNSLQALDIGLAERPADAVAVVAFLLLSLPGLQRLAIDGLGQACALIQNQTFEETEEFTSREGLPNLHDLFARRIQEERRHFPTSDEDGFALEGRLDKCLSLDGQKAEKRLREGSSVGAEINGQRSDEESGLKNFLTRLKDVNGASLETLKEVGMVCPDLLVLSLDCNAAHGERESGFDQGMVLAAGLGGFSSRLVSLSLQFTGPLSDIVPALKAAGSRLLSLYLEGIKADGQGSLVELIHACPALTSLTVHLDQPSANREEDDDDEEEEDEDLLLNMPCLPQLQTLTLNFSLDEGQMKPMLNWRSLKEVLWALLRGASLIQKISLIAVPCRLDPVFKLVLNHSAKPRGAVDHPPLQNVRCMKLNRSDITMTTVVNITHSCTRLSSLDLSGCWGMTLKNITKLQSSAKRRRQRLQITWI